MDNATECHEFATECTGWQWCGWCQGQPGGCEFCAGAGKRGCPAVVGDTDGRKWEHAPIGSAARCAECSEEIHPASAVFRRPGDSGSVAHWACVSPAYGAAPTV